MNTATDCCSYKHLESFLNECEFRHDDLKNILATLDELSNPRSDFWIPHAFSIARKLLELFFEQNEWIGKFSDKNGWSNIRSLADVETMWLVSHEGAGNFMSCHQEQIEFFWQFSSRALLAIRLLVQNIVLHRREHRFLVSCKKGYCPSLDETGEDALADDLDLMARLAFRLFHMVDHHSPEEFLDMANHELIQ